MAAPCRFRAVAVAASEKARFCRSCPATLIGIRRSIRGLLRWPPLTGMGLGFMRQFQHHPILRLKTRRFEETRSGGAWMQFTPVTTRSYCTEGQSREGLSTLIRSCRRWHKGRNSARALPKMNAARAAIRTESVHRYSPVALAKPLTAHHASSHSSPIPQDRKG